ncbi:dirigent protein 22-like [Salvia miltiorrhiza]|uniref:dirigent protein 22-like n=1 Tax=Salvia miltiorrhiza TaxID=226208 RepID=UPI0025AD1012|nr:dirigent protein 22-like [Salvia miltiorrhiza]
MAKVISLMFLSLLISMLSAIHAENSGNSLPFLKTKVIGAHLKLTQLHFYVQDIAGGANHTVYEVAQASITANSASRFGQVKVMDHLITAEPDQGSAVVGRVQGLITSSDLGVMGFATNLNFYFTVGKYNGSTISIVGRNEIGQAMRELPVVGGTGLFRFATGYSVSSTYSYDAATSHTVIEYTFYVKSASARLKNIEQELV